jgi:hypothetical protein
MKSLILALFFLVCSCSASFCQAPPASAPQPSTPAPETGFVSPTQYTNAFFGFTLPLPKDPDVAPMSRALRASIFGHFVFGLGSLGADVAVLTVTANPLTPESKDAAKEASAGVLLKPTQVEIGGKDFWRSESVKDSHNTNQTIVFATSLNGYVLQFRILVSTDKVKDELEQCIHGLAFFDPANAKEMAGAGSSPYNPGAPPPVTTYGIAGVSDGAIAGNSYSNPELGFRYEFPSGWVVNGKATHGDHCTKTLLFVTRYAKGAQAGQFNPLIILMAIDPGCSPGVTFPKAVDDRAAIQRIASHTMRFFQQASFESTGPARVRAFNGGGKVMLEISQSLSVTGTGSEKPLIVPSSTILMESKGVWVVWMFASNTQAELDELRKTKIFFDAPSATQN